MAPKKRRTWIPAVVAVAVLALAGGGFAAYALTRPQPAVGSSAESALIDACRDAVRARLKSPSTAQFPGNDRVEQTGKVYRVFGSVDAQNAFGAMLREDYRCVANVDGDGWSIYSVDFP